MFWNDRNSAEENLATVASGPVSQTNPHETRSDKYRLVNTLDLIESFKQNGWQPVSQTKVSVRNESREGFQPHLIRFEHPDYMTIPGLSREHESRPQLCLYNSHDGSSALRIYVGILRMACANGIIAGKSIVDYRITHKGNDLPYRLADAVYHVEHGLPALIDAIGHMAKTHLTRTDENDLARRASAYRLKNIASVCEIDSYSTLKPRRIADQGTDLYSIYNRLQETLLRGGLRYWVRSDADNGPVICKRTRRLRGIKSQIDANQWLYDETMQLTA